MKTLRFGALAILLTAAASASASASTQFYQGEWKPCTFIDDLEGPTRELVDPIYQQKSDLDKFECTKVKAPLCHEGVCKSNKTIELFVKRKVATAKPADDKKPQSIWFLNGGPGFPNYQLEPAMTALYYTMNSTINVYSVDHRGVGQSNPLECGIPQSSLQSLADYAACINKLLPEMDNSPVAYSATSAAMDVKKLIESFNQEEETFVYGGSYGTYWNEHVMHLAPPPVKGYILDGVINESGNPKFTFTEWNKNRRPTTIRLFDYCAKSSECPLKLTSSSSSSNLHDQVLQQLKALDESPNECVQNDQMKPSVYVRETVNQLFLVEQVSATPYLLSLFFKCDANAQQQLSQFAAALKAKSQDPPAVEDPATSFNMMLCSLILYADLWRIPTPSLEEMDQMYLDGVIVTNRTDEAKRACLFLNARDRPPYCKSVDLPANAQPFSYDRDQFYNKTAPIPKGSSVLFLNGKLDLNTPVESQELEFNNMPGEAKMAVQFDYGGHMLASQNDTQRCAVNVIASYITGRGDTSKVDTSCVASTPKWDWSGKGFQEWLAGSSGSTSLSGQEANHPKC